VAQVVVGPGESTETAFRREIRGSWFGWTAAHEEGDAEFAKVKLDEILKHARKIGIARLSDLSLAATLGGKNELAAGKLEQARASLEAATLLDPNLPEARWGDFSLAAASGRWAEVPAKALAAIRADFADRETSRILLSRLLLLAAFTIAAVGGSVLVFSVLSHGSRLFHDLVEVASSWRAGATSPVVAAGLVLAPLILSFDPLWWLVVVAVAAFGYASRRERLIVAIAFVCLVPFFPVLEGVGEWLGVTASPILRGAEALEESRYDQRVLDDLEAVKNVVPGDPDISFLLGCLYQALGQNDRAVAEFTTAAASSPGETRALVNRGNIRFVDGDFGSAQEDFQEALRRNPSDVTARYNLSLVYAETFRTLEAARALKEARALDARMVQRLQDRASLVKVASIQFSPEDARVKVDTMERDPRSRRLLGHFRAGQKAGAWKMPFVWALLLAPSAAYLLDAFRRRGRGYAVSCQKCGRNYCARCKPRGENVGLCSQCIHVYLKKDGVSIETKMLKVEEVKRRRELMGRLRGVMNFLLPGTTPFFDGRPAFAVLTLALFFLGLFTAFGWTSVVASPRPGMPAPALLSFVLPLLTAVCGWALAQVPARKS
jgi:tetratricopeptide (TPR) repeat protein